MNAIPIDETDSYVLFTEHENVLLFDKDLNIDVFNIEMYGNVTKGLISLNNEWVALGGEKLIIWINQTFYTIPDSQIKYIHDIRQLSDYEIEILIDPWVTNSAIWKLIVNTFEIIKVRDFNDYHEQPYSENVIW